MKAGLVAVAASALLCSLCYPVAAAETVIEAWRGGAFSGPMCVAVNSDDGSCWVVDQGNNQVVHLGADGTELWRGGGFSEPWSASVYPEDGSCWVADTYNNQVVHLGADGTQLWRGGAFSLPWSVSAYPSDGSCWVADTGNDEVVHLGADGSELWRGGSFSWPQAVAVDPSDGSCWVADALNNEVVHLGADGTEVWRGGGYDWPEFVAVDPGDSSCWVTDYYNNQVVHLAPDGTEIYRGGSFSAPEGISAYPTDGSCWVADTGNNGVVHLAQDGTELWRGEDFSGPWSVAVDVGDGSCWVADTGNNEVVHLMIVVPPVADFTGNPTTGPAPLEVSFTDQSTGSPTAWAWTFGDGGSSTGQSPSHSYSGTGPYTVALTVTNAADSDTMTRPGYITVTAPSLEADFAAAPTSGIAPLEVDFSDLSTGSPTAWAWTFGDGGTSSEQHPSHVYIATGSYAVALTVTNAGGSDIMTKPGCITVTIPAPEADFSATPTSGIAPLEVNFTDLSAGNPTAWAWTFGDGGSSAGQSPSHNYSGTGSYTVELTVANAGGSDIMTKPGYITVTIPAPEAGFSATPTSGIAPLEVSFSDLSTGGPTAWTWSFGDGGSSGEQHPTHEYQNAGTYTISLTVSNEGGEDTETQERYVLVAFSDVLFDHWALPYVIACVDAGIVGGYWDGTYRPELPVNRSQMAVFIGRALVTPDQRPDLPGYTPPETPTFSDAPTDYWAYKYIEYCFEQEVVGGYWDDTYRPEAEVNRAQMAVFVARGMVDPAERPDLPSYTPPGTPVFSDVLTDHWAYKYIEYCFEQEVVGGYWDGTYRPDEVVNRAQMAVFIARAFELPT